MSVKNIEIKDFVITKTYGVALIITIVGGGC